MKYRMMVAGLPRDRVYTLVSWPVMQNGPVENIKGVTLDVTGLAICSGTPGTSGSADNPNDPIDIAVQPIAGEPSRFGLVSVDGANRVFAKVVPIPLRREDKGCSVDAILLTPGSELVLVVGSGFPANTELTMDTNSEGEHHGGKGKANADGRYVSAILPYKQGLTKGTATINLKGGQCALSVNVNWGRCD